MKREHIEKIRSRGFWRVNFQPLIDKQRLSLPECKDIVENNSVRLRGWDYPHIPRRFDDTHGLDPHSNYYQGWTDWASYKEMWRMYQSGQYLHYMGLREDWDDEDSGWPRSRDAIAPGTKLNIIGSVIYEFTEIYEFLSRLVKAGIYDGGVKVSISLINTGNRELWVSDPFRMGFFSPQIANDNKIEFNQTYQIDELIADPYKAARAAMRYIFERFGWNASEDVLVSDQAALIKVQK